MTYLTYAGTHFLLLQGNMQQVPIGWATLEGKPAASALFLPFICSPSTIADDGSVYKVCCDKVSLFPVPVTGYIVGIVGKIVVLIIPGVLFHDH